MGQKKKKPHSQSSGLIFKILQNYLKMLSRIFYSIDLVIKHSNKNPIFHSKEKD